jgi:hypothetical protein
MQEKEDKLKQYQQYFRMPFTRMPNLSIIFKKKI